MTSCPRSFCGGELFLEEDGWYRCDVCGFATGDPVNLPAWMEVKSNGRRRR